MLSHRNDENTITGRGHTLITASNSKTKKMGSSSTRKVLGSKKNKATTIRKFGTKLSSNTGRKANKSSIKKAPLRTTNLSSNNVQVQQLSTTKTTEHVELSSSTSSSAAPVFDGGINRRAALSALQMGVRATTTTAVQDMIDTTQCAAMGGDRGFDGLDDEIEVTSNDTTNDVAILGSGLFDTEPTLGDLSFGDISSDDSSDESENDVEDA